MIYSVRWAAVEDSEEYRSRDLPTAADALELACTILDQMEVGKIRIVDMSGRSIMTMPEIIRSKNAKKGQ